MWLLILYLFPLLFVNAAAGGENSSAFHFHQSDYRVKMDRMEVIFFNTTYLKGVKAEFVWYNRSQRVINGTGYLLKHLSWDSRGHIQLYKMLSNEYRFFPITIPFNMCDHYKLNSFNCQDLFNRTSNIDGCPVEPKFYYIKNVVIDFSTFPPYIPSGSYKIEFKGYHKSDFVSEFHFYGSVEEKIKKWES